MWTEKPLERRSIRRSAYQEGLTLALARELKPEPLQVGPLMWVWSTINGETLHKDHACGCWARGLLSRSHEEALDNRGGEPCSY